MDISPETIMYFVMFIVFAVLSSVLGFFGVMIRGRMTKGGEKEWRRTARKLGMAYTPTEQGEMGEMEGYIENQSVYVSADYISSLGGLWPKYTTRISAPFGLDRRELHVLVETRGAADNLIRGETGMQVGDPKFDSVFAVNADTPQALHAFLTPYAQQCLLDLSRYGRVRVDKNGVVLKVKGLLKEPRKLSVVIQRVAATVRALPRIASGGW